MEKILLRLILNYTFYEQNKHRLLKEFFPNNLHNIYSLIEGTHNKLKKDITLDELKLLYKVAYPATTQAQWNLIEQVLDDVPGEVSEDVIKEVISKAWVLEYGRRIAQAGIEICNGKQTSFEEVREILTKIEQGNDLNGEDDLQAVSSELEDILEIVNQTTKWSFNLEPLKIVASGLGPGIMCIVAARVEVGKTLFGVSLVAAPGGLAEQGALTHFYCNEENPQRTQARAIMSWTGMTLQELLLDPEKAKRKYKEISNNIKFFDSRGKSIGEIHQHITRHSPDIVLFDLLDKQTHSGVFAREDERLGALYASARDHANVNSYGVVAISQLNAESEGKTYVSSANLSNARTAKGAEGDLVFGIGKGPLHEESVRIINIIKNKITGQHNEVVCAIRPEISRYIA